MLVPKKCKQQTWPEDVSAMEMYQQFKKNERIRNGVVNKYSCSREAKSINIAEDEVHHPDLHLTGYKNLKVVLYTHALGGVTENDLIVAAKISQLSS